MYGSGQWTVDSGQLLRQGNQTVSATGSRLYSSGYLCLHRCGDCYKTDNYDRPAPQITRICETKQTPVENRGIIKSQDSELTIILKSDFGVENSGILTCNYGGTLL